MEVLLRLISCTMFWPDGPGRFTGRLETQVAPGGKRCVVSGGWSGAHLDSALEGSH